MPESREEAQFRQHLAEMRKAAAGLGKDFAREIGDLDTKIEKFGTATGKGAKYLALDIQDDFATLGRSIASEAKKTPGRIRDAGVAIGSGTARAAGAVRDGVMDAGHRAKEGTKNAFATAAGVKRTPMKEWSPPSSDESPPKDA
jgi:hypothetical protein